MIRRARTAAFCALVGYVLPSAALWSIRRGLYTANGERRPMRERFVMWAARLVCKLSGRGKR